MLEAAAETDSFPLDVALTILLGVCAGLHHAHDRRGPDGQPLELVHRDVSPSNVMVSYDGSVKVTDFGIATAGALTRTTRAGTLKGKVSYMSPEQCRGGAIDRRADIFALGILLYEATLLTRLFVGDNDYALMNQVIEGTITSPREIDRSYPPQLEAIVMRALARDPADRFPTAAALQSTLEAFAVSHGLHLSTMRVASWMERTMGVRPHPSTELAARAHAATHVATQPSHSRRGALVGVGVAALAMAGVAALTALAWPEAQQAPAAAVAPPPVDDTAPPPKPEIVLVPTPLPMPAKEAAPEEEELIVLEEEPGEEPRTTARRPTARPRRKAQRTYDLDEAAPPR
jgi:serine/threonine-protein kinase